MSDLIYLLAILVCPVAMGAMMLVMMRGSHSDKSRVGAGDEVARLRAEVQQLREERNSEQTSSGM
jgi:uncharacterized protein YbaR (Trm112 family)